MPIELTGHHLVAGTWVAGDRTFRSEPALGPSHDFSVGRVGDVETACDAAEASFEEFAATSRAQRAVFLESVADEIEARGNAITEIGAQETGLAEARLVAERGRTVGQLRLFAAHVLAGGYLDRRHDVALPERLPQPRPDLRLIQRPVGPVAVFGASNFPLAFSTAGGDTAAALAAGCPVVVKGHSAHPGTGEIVARAIEAAIRSCGMPAGVFSLIQGGNREVGQALVQHPFIKAVGFTGSLAGGRALFDLCARRPEPIPFFGELGSVNPMFVLPQALGSRGEEIARGWAASLTLGVGQFCTNPGIAVVLDGAVADAFVDGVARALSTVPSQVMLTEGIAAAFRAGREQLCSVEGVRVAFAAPSVGRNASPCLLVASGTDWLHSHRLGEEVFGPLGLVVKARDQAQMIQIARALQGQLACALQMDADDTALARTLLPVLERKAGRILVNGFSTGVEVCESMVHGGPYPASTNFGATSVGTMSIRRFLRPVCLQDFPEALLPDDLH